MRILIYTGYARIDPDRLKTAGVGGSEVAAINLARSFAERGHDVAIGGICPDIVRDNVRYIPTERLRDYLRDTELDALIVSRYIEFFENYTHKAARVYLWLHDTCALAWNGTVRFPNDGNDLLDTVKDRLSGVVCLTDWHVRRIRYAHPPLAHVPFYVIGNGLDLSTFPDGGTRRQANRLMWSSCPERGLDRVLALFPEIKKRVPSAELHVATYAGSHEASVKLRERVERTSGAYFLGSLSQVELHEQMARTDVWFYPTNHPETYCITALEMMASGVLCVANRFAALSDVLRGRGVLFDGNKSDAELVELVVACFGETRMRQEARRWARAQTWACRADAWLRLFSTDKARYVKRTGICLCMMVRNEAKLLPRLFDTLQGVIDYYVICDTGSDDGTPELIETIMSRRGIPGEIHRHKWVDFGTNRQLATDAAIAAGKGDFLLRIDADEEFHVDDPTFYENLDPEFTYAVEMRAGSHSWYLPSLMNVKKSRWKWKGAVHCYAAPETPIPEKRLQGAWISFGSNLGAKTILAGSPRNKYLIDAAILERETKLDPTNSRAWYYLAQSYDDAGEEDKAFETFVKVATMPNGWAEERYVACCRIVTALIAKKANEREIAGWAIYAQSVMPCRLEAVYEFVRYCNASGLFALGLAVGRGSLGVFSADGISWMYRRDLYDWLFIDELALCAYYSGDYACALKLYARLFESDTTPCEQRGRIATNLEFAKKRLSNPPSFAMLNERREEYIFVL